MSRGRIASFVLSIILLIIFVYFIKEKIVEFADIDYWILFFFVFVLISAVIYAAIHEFGHVLFGWATGYKLDAFAVLGYTFVKIDNGYVLKKMYIPGTAGANMMHHKESKTNAPYGLYTMGGVIVTAIVTVVSIALMILINNAFISLFFYAMVLAGTLMTIYNVIPMKTKNGVYNDGMLLRLFKEDERSQEIFNKGQEVNLLALKGVSIKDTPEELFEIPESYKTAPFANELRINKSEYLMYNGRYDEAKSELESVISELEESDKALKSIAACLLLLDYMTDETDKEKVENLYQNNKKDIEILSKYYITAKYVTIAYKLKFENEWNIDREVMEFYKLAKKQDLNSGIELELMEKLLNENSMTCLIPSN